MAAFNVTALPDFGYPEITKFIDPMEPRWRAKPFAEGEFTTHTGVFSNESVTASVQNYASANPYSDVANITKALDSYWAARQPLKARKNSDDCDDDDDNASDDLSHSHKHGNKTLKGDDSGPVPRYRRFRL